MQITESQSNTGEHQSCNDASDVSNVRTRSPDHRAKAEAFWQKLKVRRQIPGNCKRCGRTHDGIKAQCLKCLAYQAKYRARLYDKSEKMTAGQVVASVVKLRREVTKLREMFKQSVSKRRNEYSKGYATGTKHGVAVAKYADSYGKISKQELSTINHAYDHAYDHE